MPVVPTLVGSFLTCRRSGALGRGLGVSLMYFKCDLSTGFVFTRTAYSLVGSVLGEKKNLSRLRVTYLQNHK